MALSLELSGRCWTFLTRSTTSSRWNTRRACPSNVSPCYPSCCSPRGPLLRLRRRRWYSEASRDECERFVEPQYIVHLHARSGFHLRRRPLIPVWWKGAIEGCAPSFEMPLSRERGVADDGMAPLRA